MRTNVIRIDLWDSARHSAIREAQLSRLQHRQDRVPVESLEWPPPPAVTWRDQIIGLGLVIQLLWWVVSGKLFRAM